MRLREGNVCRRELSRLALADGFVAGACRIWPIEASSGVPALFLGPIAVDINVRSRGLGQRLVAACLRAIDAEQSCHVILVGDLSFFGRMGFDVVPDGKVKMPGPVDPKRLLWRLGKDFKILPAGDPSVPHATSLAG